LPNKKAQNQIEELEEKLGRQNQAIDAYREQLKNLSDYKSERDLYSELSTVFAQAENFDEVFKKTLDAISEHLKARYYGIFWIDDRSELFMYRLGKGYNAKLMSEIPYNGSMMGDSLYKRTILWEPQFNTRGDYIPLNQDPGEYNVLCSPIVLMGNDAGVVRLANIDPAVGNKAVLIMQIVTQLLCSSLERLKLQQQNESTLRSLDASFSIARLLENTLNKQEILKQICPQVPRLFNCVGSVIAMRDKDGAVKPAFSWPDNFFVTGNQISGAIYLRNLLERFPTGNCLIPNVHGEERCWSWPDPKVRSLCMAPIQVQEAVQGIIVAIGPAGETYTNTQSNLLGLVAAQTSMTLERASYFSKQEDLARCDGLTGLLNHRMFQEIIREEYNRVKRYGNPLSLVMLDIDHFKKFNDAYGHPVGDEVIKMVSRTIRSMIRATDRAFRYGGEEFALVLPETSVENGALLAERIRRQIEANRSVKGLVITISIGVGGVNISETPEAFIKRVDGALYEAKETGRNRVAVC
jgi:diguanylate cyclase (GGDEF)-like protein